MRASLYLEIYHVIVVEDVHTVEEILEDTEEEIQENEDNSDTIGKGLGLIRPCSRYRSKPIPRIVGNFYELGS